MFRVFVNDGNQEIPDDDIMYIVCKEGVYLKKKLGIMESITPVTSISVLKSVEMTAQMHIKPIPGTQFAPVISFFKQVYTDHYGEAIVLLFYNEERKVYKIVPPAQKVSGAGVDYSRAMQIDGYTMIGDIHSHANMSAFHSGVDDKDEDSFDGLHITIGNNRDAEVSISASIVSNGKRFIVDPEDYIDGIKRTVDIDEVINKPMTQYYTWDSKEKKLIPKQSTGTYQVKRYDRRYISTVSRKYQKHPAEWMSVVEKKVWTNWHGNNYGNNWNQNYGWWRNWDTDKFDPNVWKNFKEQQGSPLANPPLVPATTKPITFPTHPVQQASGPVETIIPDKPHPCEKCPFRDHKIEWIMEQLRALNDDDMPAVTVDNEGNEIEWYRCEECGTVVPSPDGNAVCPTCNTDDYLMLMDEGDFASNVVNASLDSGLDWYKCSGCSSIFETSETNAICPICKTNANLQQLYEGNPQIPQKEPPNFSYKCKDCGTETSVLNNGDCPFCGGEIMDNIDRDALIAAQEEDETFPIPVPDTDKIPLTTSRKHGIFSRLFKKDKK
jgi:PRTRC genetic system protein A